MGDRLFGLISLRPKDGDSGSRVNLNLYYIECPYSSCPVREQIPKNLRIHVVQHCFHIRWELTAYEPIQSFTITGKYCPVQFAHQALSSSATQRTSPYRWSGVVDVYPTTRYIDLDEWTFTAQGTESFILHHLYQC